MSASGLKPIPTPLPQRLHQFQRAWLPGVVLLGALVAIGCLWQQRGGVTTMVGQAEGGHSNVSSHQAGVLTGLRVARFQKVQAGQLLGEVWVAEPQLLEASLGVIRSELAVLRANLAPGVAAQRNAEIFAQRRLDWMRHRTDLASARVHLQVAEAEQQRTEALAKDQTASQHELDVARSASQVRQKQIEELASLVAEGEQSLTNLLSANPTNDLGLISDEPLRAALLAQEARLRLTEAQLSPVALRAPITGTITAVFFHNGESVTAGQPIVTIAADDATRIVGYLRVPIGPEPPPGASVMVRSRSGLRESGAAQILEVAAQLDALPLALQASTRPTELELALPVNISLPSRLQLRPGELVDISVISSTQ